MTTIVLPENYGYVPLVIGFIGLVQFSMGASIMSARKSFRKKEFLENTAVKAMREEHKKVFGTDINNNGYPDTGSGRYSDHLPYEDWVNLNNAQRSHLNMIEQSGPVLACIAVGGLYFPRWCSLLGGLYGVGRLMYTYGYTSSGADGRLPGALTATVTFITLCGTCAYVGVVESGLIGIVRGALKM